VHHYNGTQYCNTETVLFISPFSRPTSHLRRGHMEERGQTCCQHGSGLTMEYLRRRFERWNQVDTWRVVAWWGPQLPGHRKQASALQLCVVWQSVTHSYNRHSWTCQSAFTTTPRSPEARLSQSNTVVMLRVVTHFTKSLKVVQGHSKLHWWVRRM